MIMPGTVGDRWFIGISEASVLSFGYLYLLSLRHWLKPPTKRNPYIEESKHFHY
jgi:hypothetical protein